MKNRILLKIILGFTILVELVMMVMVYQKIGNERLPIQIGRLVFQLFLMVFILTEKSKTATFILAGFHMITSMLHFYAELGWLSILLGSFHLIFGMIIYFNTEIEEKFAPKLNT